MKEASSTFPLIGTSWKECSRITVEHSEYHKSPNQTFKLQKNSERELTENSKVTSFLFSLSKNSHKEIKLYSGGFTCYMNQFEN